MIICATNPYEHKCPVCGLISPFTDCSTTMVLSGRRTSRREVEAYQSLYGDLIKFVDHYKE